MMSTTREMYIEHGTIRPSSYHLRSHGRELDDKTVRQNLIEAGRVRPAPDGMPMAQIYREFLYRAVRNHMGREHKLDCKGGA